MLDTERRSMIRRLISLAVLTTLLAACSPSSDWPQFRQDPTHRGRNGGEFAISSATVASLGVAWRGATGDSIISSPAVADGVVYVGSNDGKLYAFAVSCGSGGAICTPIWTGATGGPVRSSPAVADGVVYVDSDDGKIYAFAVSCGSGGATCTPLWSGAAGNTISSPTVVNGVVYIGGDRLSAFAVGCATGGATCPPIWTSAMINGPFESSPAVADGVVYVGSNNGNLYAFAVGCGSGGATCTPLWIGSPTLFGATSGPMNSAPTVADGVVYVGSGNNRLLAFAVGCATGGAICAPLWSGATGGSAWSSPAVADGIVYVSSIYLSLLGTMGSVTGNLYAFAVGCATGGATCTPLWSAAAGSFSSPAVANGLVYTSAYEGKLRVFAVGCGSGGATCLPLWSSATGSSIRSSPVVANGVVYIGSDDGYLYAFALNVPPTPSPSPTPSPTPSPVPLGRICVTKFNDLDADGVRDAGDYLLPWSFTITPSAGAVVSVTTGAKGEQACRDLPSGVYSVWEVTQSGWLNTAPLPVGPQSVTLGAGQTVSIVFGNFERPLSTPTPSPTPQPTVTPQPTITPTPVPSPTPTPTPTKP
jgi:outer membrane protein assembly factor BamB